MKSLKTNSTAAPLIVFAATLAFLLAIGMSGWETREQTPQAVRLSLKRHVVAKFKSVQRSVVNNPLLGYYVPYSQTRIWNEPASETWEAVWINDSLILSEFPPQGIEQNTYPEVSSDMEQREDFIAYVQKEIFSCQVAFLSGEEILVPPQDYPTWLSEIEQPATLLYWHGLYIKKV